MARKLSVAALAILLGVACSGNREVRPVGSLELEHLIRNRGLEPAHVVLPYKLTAEMRAWAHSKVPPSVTDPDEKLYHLNEALFDPDGFEIEYASRYTGTAEEVFESRRANCLAFTHLFVGMARELGVAVFFLEVRDVETYRKEGDLIVVSDHIAVGYGPLHELRIIDFAARESVEYRRIQAVDDYRAIAMYYSNRGAEELRANRLDEALDWLRLAVAIDPGYAASWVNLGVVLRRSDMPEAAEQAYRRALEMDLHSTTALQNLAALLNYRGDTEEAMSLLELADRTTNRNPYTYVTLGDLSLKHGRVEEAGRFYRKAVRRQEGNAEPLAAMGLWELRQGERKKAHRWLRKAESVDPESPRVARLKRALESGHEG